MTDSLIPYTFVPGTKAKASEVNANFVAVAEAINLSNGAISDLSTEMNTALDGRLDLTMSNSHNLTNCIVAAPNGVASYSSLTITAKSGLKVLMPNGRNTDGSLKNTVYTVQSDISSTDTISSGNRIFALTSAGALLILYKDCFLQGDSSSRPATVNDANTYVYFATDENKMYTTSGSTTADWTQVNLCTLGSYNVSNSTIYYFDVKSYFNITDLVNPDLTNLTYAGELHFIPTGNTRMDLSSTGAIATIGGRKYYKSYSDKCICAICSNSSSNIAPLLVGETERSVTAYDDSNTTPRVTGSFAWKGKTYYYHWDNQMSLGSTLNIGSLVVSFGGYASGEIAAKNILQKYYKSICEVMPTYNSTDASTGYRLWGDGFKEQWGYKDGINSSGVTVTLPRSFSNTNYAILTGRGGNNPGLSENIYWSNRGTSSFKLYVNRSEDRNTFWYACGY